MGLSSTETTIAVLLALFACTASATDFFDYFNHSVKSNLRGKTRTRQLNDPFAKHENKECLKKNGKRGRVGIDYTIHYVRTRRECEVKCLMMLKKCTGWEYDKKLNLFNVKKICKVWKTGPIEPKHKSDVHCYVNENNVNGGMTTYSSIIGMNRCISDCKSATALLNGPFTKHDNSECRKRNGKRGRENIDYKVHNVKNRHECEEKCHVWKPCTGWEYFKSVTDGISCEVWRATEIETVRKRDSSCYYFDKKGPSQEYKCISSCNRRIFN